MQHPILLQMPYNIQPVRLDQKYIQILFSGNENFGHWICIFYNENVIHVYDSSNNKGLHDDHKIYLNRLFPNAKNLKIVFEEVQNQGNNYDCGVFAIAFATALLNNQCPCTIRFERHEMRNHLLTLYTDFCLNMFPISHYCRNSNYTNENFSHSQALLFSPINFTSFDLDEFLSLKYKKIINKKIKKPGPRF